MKHKKHFPHLLLVLALCLTLLPIPAFSASNIYLTSVNDNLLPLNSATMPFWSGSILYVPASALDNTGLGLSCSYNRDYNVVSIYTQDLSNPRILVFDMANGTIRDDITQKEVPGKGIMRNGRPFLPISVICTFFGLSYNYCHIPTVDRGYLVRIKSSSAVLSDALFMEAGKNLITKRVQEYNQSITPPTPSVPPSTDPSTDPTPLPPVVDDEPDTGAITYLAFTCRSEDGVSNILDTLEYNHEHALFLVTADLLRNHGQLVRRMVGNGHIVGLLADGESWQESRSELSNAQDLLARLTFTRATAVYVPTDQQKAAANAGWVCWSPTLTLSPSASVSASTFTANTLRQLKGRTQSIFLSLPSSQDTARILPTFLHELKNQHFDPVLPLETRL